MLIRARLLRILKTVLTAAACFIGVYFAAVLAGGLIPVNRGWNEAESGEGQVYLEDNGRHIDIWLPASFCGFLPEGEAAEGNGTEGWVSFGWGDRNFFLGTPNASDIRIGLALKALFLPSRAAVAVYRSQVPPAGKNIIGLRLRRSEMEALSGYIGNSLLRGRPAADRIPDQLVNTAYGDVEFYEAGGWYSLFFTCNNWCSRALKKAGISTHLWTPFTLGVYKL